VHAISVPFVKKGASRSKQQFRWEAGTVAVLADCRNGCKTSPSIQPDLSVSMKLNEENPEDVIEGQSFLKDILVIRFSQREAV
jgi:hypothetical protein